MHNKWFKIISKYTRLFWQHFSQICPKNNRQITIYKLWKVKILTFCTIFFWAVGVMTKFYYFWTLCLVLIYWCTFIGQMTIIFVTTKNNSQMPIIFYGQVLFRKIQYQPTGVPVAQSVRGGVRQQKVPSSSPQLTWGKNFPHFLPTCFV